MLWHFLLDQIPWWVQVLGIVVVIGVPALIIASMAFGWPATLTFLVRWGGLILGALAAIGFLGRARQQGYQDRKVEEQQAQKEADDVADKARDDVRKLPDEALDRETDRWSKH